MKVKSALEYFKEEKLFTGWNLGDTLDAHEDRKSGETLWDNPKANQELFNGIKKSGFDIVRIPVTWMGHFGSAPDYIIEEKFLKRVAEVTGYANNAGLKAIINMHHDGMTENGGNDLGWHSVIKASKDQKGYDEVTEVFSSLWKQIADFFKDHGDWLFFESMNEIHDGNWGYDSDGEMNISESLKTQFDIVNKWNQIFTDTVRITGANNKERILLIPGYCTVAEHTLASYFKLPDDTTQNRQVVTFHYYDPYEFTIEGSQSSWGTEEDKKKLDDDFLPFKEKYINKGIPVIIGESGAVLQLYLKDKQKEEKAKECRLEYIKNVYSKAKEYGLVAIYWDSGAVTGDGEKFGLFNRKNGEPNSSHSEAIIKAITCNSQ